MVISFHVVKLMILGLVHLDAINSSDADLAVVPAKRQIQQRQRKPLKIIIELLQCRCGFTKGTTITGPIRQFLSSS